MKKPEKLIDKPGFDLQDWISWSPAAFNVRRHLTGPDEEAENIWIHMCEMLVQAGILEHCRDERGWYRPLAVDCPEMDLEHAIAEPVDIWLPFELSDLVELYPGNMVIVAGSKSSGKSCVCLNIARENRTKFDAVHYFNSEMEAPELKKRLDLMQWWERDGFHAYRRSKDFASVIRPGVGNLNIIDFLEVHGSGAGDEFYSIGARLKEIHDALKGSICIVALQKNRMKDLGLGGERSWEVCRLYLSLNKGKAKITEAKHWRDPKYNPNGLTLDFKLIMGSTLKYRRVEGQPAWYEEGEDI